MVLDLVLSSVWLLVFLFYSLYFSSSSEVCPQCHAGTFNCATASRHSSCSTFGAHISLSTSNSHNFSPSSRNMSLGAVNNHPCAPLRSQGQEISHIWSMFLVESDVFDNKSPLSTAGEASNSPEKLLEHLPKIWIWGFPDLPTF